VIAARGSAPRRPQDEDPDGDGFDELAAGLTFDRGSERPPRQAPEDPGLTSTGPNTRLPEEVPDAELSDVEQRLLHQLHQELAAREGESGSGDQASQAGGYRGNGANGANGGGRTPRPPRPMGPPPPDRSG
jgi:hypothetical protein